MQMYLQRNTRYFGFTVETVIQWLGMNKREKGLFKGKRSREESKLREKMGNKESKVGMRLSIEGRSQQEQQQRQQQELPLIYSLISLGPSVTLAMALIGRLKWGKVPFYVVGQFLGGFLSAPVIYGVYYTAIRDKVRISLFCLHKTRL